MSSHGSGEGGNAPGQYYRMSACFEVSAVRFFQWLAGDRQVSP